MQAPEQESEEPDRTPVAVLLIEDNPEDEYAVRRMLQETPATDYAVTCVRTHAAATEALARAFDVCLLDYDLGAFTAPDLLKELDMPSLAGPVILLTGHDNLSIAQSVLDLGVTDFLSKSEVRTNMLVRTIGYANRRFDDQRRLNFLARHDALTGLLNRHAFLQAFETWLASAAYKNSETYLLYLDLDGFKAVNDSWGHDVGDQVLQHAAQSLKACLRESDLAVRYGGDELVAAVAHVDDQTIARLPEKILRQLRTPIVVDGRQIVVTASIGIARAHHAPDDAAELIRLADHAMFAAKSAGRDAVRTYSEEIPLAQRGRAALESDLREALEHDQLHLSFQPHVDMQTREIRGAEALARWTHPEQGPISPAQFIPLAEECGLIRQLTFWSLDAALAALADWQQNLDLPSGFRLAVNVSPPQLLDPNFPAHLEFLLNKHGIDRRWLRLEITENFFVHGSAADTLAGLIQDGLSLALDDFGTGYSSLAMLSQLPIDTLKIDRAFVTRMGGDERAVTLIRGLISLGRDMQLEIIAEGIESEVQHQQLLSYGCQIGQGYLYAYPENSGALAERIAGVATAGSIK